MDIKINIDLKFLSKTKKFFINKFFFKLITFSVLPIISISILIAGIVKQNTRIPLEIPENGDFFFPNTIIESSKMNEYFQSPFAKGNDIELLASNIQATAEYLRSNLPTPEADALENSRRLAPVSIIPGTGSVTNFIFAGVNVNIVNGSQSTTTQNGLKPNTGNLIIGYNESPGELPTPNWINDCLETPAPLDSFTTKIGSHNLIVGSGHIYDGFANVILGYSNHVNGNFSSIVGGNWSVVNGDQSTIAGSNVTNIWVPTPYPFPCTLDGDNLWNTCSASDSGACSTDGDSPHHWYEAYCGPQ